MRILILTQKVDINDDVLGFFHGWIKEFAKQFEDIIVICLERGEHGLPKNVKVLSLGKEKGKSKLKYLINFYKYIWRQRNNYDTVFVHMNQIYVILGGLFWKLWHKKISLWYAHGHVDWRLSLAKKIADVIFTSTQEGFRIKSRKVRIVGQGIDIEKFKPVPKKESRVFRIISVGRISRSKDYKTLIRAIEELNDNNLEVKIIGGPGLSEDEVYLKGLKELIKRKRLGQVLRFIGPKPNRDIIEFLQTADLFVNMSHTGSLDKAVLEAMACGLPILTCNEALGDVLGKYAENLMYPKKDFKALAKKIEFFAKLNNKNKKALSKDLRQIVVENHSLNSLIKKISSALKS